MGTSLSADTPAAQFRKALVKLRLIGAFGIFPHTLVEQMRIIADQNAPALRPDAVEDDSFGGLRLVVGASSWNFRARSADIF